MAIEDALAGWLGDQRWFAGKGQQLRDLAVVADTVLTEGDPELRHLVIAVAHGSATDYYQVLAGLRRELPARLARAVIGPAGDGRTAYDALHDPDLTRVLLDGIAAGQETGAGGAGADALSLRKIAGASVRTGLGSLVLGAEQSNTSVVFGGESILKVFRRLSPGPNPDLEVTAALHALGSPQVADPLGWIEATLEGVPTTLAILSRFLRTATDGWTLAATSVRDLYAAAREASARGPAAGSGASPAAGSGPGRAAGASVRAAGAGGDFGGESRRLGAATAAVHKDLAVAFGVDELGPEVAGELAAQMFAKFDVTVAAVPELAKYTEMISDAYHQVGKLRGPFPVQRVHGDYHLGQVLRDDRGWVVLDFEGEPAAPLAQRRARSSVLRDVAGMLRSYEYAARHQLIGRPDQAARGDAARDWVRRNQAEFCVGYAEAGGLDPVANQVLLRALQLDKAVYEVLYEARHRPSWLPIPLESLAEF